MKKTQYTAQDAAQLLEEIRELMELAGENPFKVRAFEKAAGLLGALAGAKDDLSERAKSGTLTELPGIGKGIAEVLTDFFVKDKTPVKDELSVKVPAALRELIRVRGLGPKKARLLMD